VTLIRDTAGNVFGGYTSLDWSSPAADAGALGIGVVWFNDDAAFLFTVVNPHADPPALFPLKANDLRVTGAFDGYCSSIISWGYINGTRHSRDTVLTGAFYFTPAEVEVWGLADH